MSERMVFTSCGNKGFQILFPGGLIASVQWGVGNYTDMYNAEGYDTTLPMKEDTWGRNLCEIGCFREHPDKKGTLEHMEWVPVHSFTTKVVEDVRGYCDASMVVGFLNAVQALDRMQSLEQAKENEHATLMSEDGERPLTPAEQSFNFWMACEKPTQADGKPKDDDDEFLYFEYEREMEEKELDEQELEDEILMNPDIFPINRPRYRKVIELIGSVFEDFDNCSDTGKQTEEAQATLSDYIEMLESMVRKFQERRTNESTNSR